MVTIDKKGAFHDSQGRYADKPGSAMGGFSLNQKFCDACGGAIPSFSDTCLCGGGVGTAPDTSVRSEPVISRPFNELMGIVDYTVKYSENNDDVVNSLAKPWNVKKLNALTDEEWQTLADRGYDVDLLKQTQARAAALKPAFQYAEDVENKAIEICGEHGLGMPGDKAPNGKWHEVCDEIAVQLIKDEQNPNNPAFGANANEISGLQDELTDLNYHTAGEGALRAQAMRGMRPFTDCWYGYDSKLNGPGRPDEFGEALGYSGLLKSVKWSNEDELAKGEAVVKKSASLVNGVQNLYLNGPHDTEDRLNTIALLAKKYDVDYRDAYREFETQAEVLDENGLKPKTGEPGTAAKPKVGKTETQTPTPLTKTAKPPKKDYSHVRMNKPPLMANAFSRPSQVIQWGDEEVSSTFPADFTIAEAVMGTSHKFDATIGDTYRRAKREWMRHPDMATSLIMTLNHKAWEHYETNPELAEAYTDMYEETVADFRKRYGKNKDVMTKNYWALD